MNTDEETPLLAASAPSSSSSSSKNTTTTTTTTTNNTSLLSKFALGAVALSVVGLIATTASLGGNFNVRDVAGHKLRQGGPSAADIKGAAPVPYDLPPSDITDVLVRVNDPKVFDVPGDSGNPNGPAADASSSSSSSSSKGSLPPVKMAGSGGSETVAAPLTINSVLTPVATVASSPEEQALEDAVTRAKVAGLVLPGSPEDPKLAEEREKKAEVIQVVTEVPEVSAASEVAAEPVAPAGSKGAKAPAAPAAAKEEVEEEVVTGPVQAVVNTGKGTGGKHGEKAKGKNDSTEEAEEVVEEVVEEAADADAEADADADADVPTAEDAKDRVVPESENYSLVDTKLSADNFPFLMHYRYSDESCTKMVAAEGFSLDVCYAAKVGGKDFFQKNVAFTTNSDTGMFSYYYTDKECTNLVQGVKELKENPATMQYKSDCYVEADSSPGRAAVVSVPDIKAVQYERMGLPQESSVIVGSYVNDQCMGTFAARLRSCLLLHPS